MDYHFLNNYIGTHTHTHTLALRILYTSKISKRVNSKIINWNQEKKTKRYERET